MTSIDYYLVEGGMIQLLVLENIRSTAFFNDK